MKFLGIGFLLILGSLLGAQEGLTKDQIKVESYLDWKAGVFILDLTAPLVRDSNVLPVNRFRTETFLAENLKEMMLGALFTLRLDSSRILQDLAADDPRLFTPLGNLVDELTQTYSRTNPGYETLTIRYSLPVFSRLMKILVNHKVPSGEFFPLGYTSTKDYTGLVVYIPKTPGTPDLVPALFPRIWDRKQDLVLDLQSMDPAYLLKWGTMIYSRSFDETPFRDRIGMDPLRVVALGIQGETPTDIVLSVTEANKIRFSLVNRKILSQGRILVIQEN